MTDRSQEFRKIVAGKIGGTPTRVWLVKEDGHRMDFLWSVGDHQPDPAKLIVWVNNYMLFGQGVPAKALYEIRKKFKDFCCSELNVSNPGVGRTGIGQSMGLTGSPAYRDPTSLQERPL